MSVSIHPATTGDLAAILALDPVARREERRHDYMSRAIAGDRGMEVRVLVLDDQVAGYAVIAEFFGHPFLERICTGETYFRRGVASALMANIEAGFEGDRLFGSCNESNKAMRTLLVGRGYKVSGVVENLDPGDPELFFVVFRDALDAAIEAATR